MQSYGLILAGGLSRRMGGGDKTLRPIGGRSMLARVIDRLKPQCAGVLLNANPDGARFAPSGLPVVADSVPDFAGPLAGVLAGLDWLAERVPEIDWMVSAPGDTPFVPTDLVARLHAERVAAGASIAWATSGGQAHWLVGLWPVALRHELRTFLVDDAQRKVAAFVTRYRSAQATWPVEPFDPFFNANAPHDLEKAERIAHWIDAASGLKTRACE